MKRTNPFDEEENAAAEAALLQPPAKVAIRPIDVMEAQAETAGASVLPGQRGPASYWMEVVPGVRGEVVLPGSAGLAAGSFTPGSFEGYPVREPRGPPGRGRMIPYFREYAYPGASMGVMGRSLDYSVDLQQKTHVEFPSIAATVKADAIGTVAAILPNLNQRHQKMLQQRIISATKGKGKKRNSRLLTPVNALAVALKAEDMAFSEGIQRLKRFRTDIKYQKHALTGHRKKSAAQKAAIYRDRWGKERSQAKSGRVRAAAMRSIQMGQKNVEVYQGP
jgi:hypothetical protein